jgi:hypothetical protein
VIQLLEKDEPAPIATGWTLTRGLVQGVRDEGQRIGARTTVMLIPLSVQIYGEALQRWLAANEVSADRLALERPQQRMREFGAAAHIEMIDLLPAFRKSFADTGRTLHLAGDGHWTVEGHQLAAALVADELLGRELVGGRASAGR